MTGNIATDSQNAKKPIKETSKLKQKANFSNEVSSSTIKSKCCISIWSTWYCLLVMALHVYLIKNHIERIYKLEKRYTANYSRSEPILLQQQDQEQHANSSVLFLTEYDTAFNIKDQLYYELVSRICLLSISFVCLILFLVSSLKQMGNYSNDGVKFGRDFFLEKLHQYPHLGGLLSVVSEPKSDKKSVEDHAEINLTSRPSVQLAVTESSSLTGDTVSSMSSPDEDASQSSTIDSLAHKKTCGCVRHFFSFIARVFKIVWRHFLPFNSFFHLLSILFLIVPDIVHQNSFQDYLPKIVCSNRRLNGSDPAWVMNIIDYLQFVNAFY